MNKRITTNQFDFNFVAVLEFHQMFVSLCSFMSIKIPSPLQLQDMCINQQTSVT